MCGTATFAGTKVVTAGEGNAGSRRDDRLAGTYKLPNGLTIIAAGHEVYPSAQSLRAWFPAGIPFQESRGGSTIFVITTDIRTNGR